MFYSDLSYAKLRQHISNYILRYHDHYTEYRNGEYVRTVDYRYITLQ